MKESFSQHKNPQPEAMPVSSKALRDLKKEFLTRYRDNELEISRLEEKIEQWESLAEKVTTCYDSIRTGHSDDRIQSAVDNLWELRSLLFDHLLDSTSLRLEIEHCIKQIADDRLRLIMEYRYIDGLTWEAVSEKLNTECRWIMRLHNRALDIIELPVG